MLEEEVNQLLSKYLKKIFEKLKNKKQPTSIPILLSHAYLEGEFIDI